MTTSSRLRRLLAASALGLVVASCARAGEAPAPREVATPAATTTPATNAGDARHPTSAASLPKVDPARLLEHIRALSADELEGRFPGTRGEDKTVEYLTKELRALGLAPGTPDGSYFTKVPLVGITGAEDRPLVVAGRGRRETFRWRDDVVA